jgi:hypothetical protein
MGRDRQLPDMGNDAGRWQLVAPGMPLFQELAPIPVEVHDPKSRTRPHTASLIPHQTPGEVEGPPRMTPPVGPSGPNRSSTGHLRIGRLGSREAVSHKRSFSYTSGARRVSAGRRCNTSRVPGYVSRYPVRATVRPCASATGGYRPGTRTPAANATHSWLPAARRSPLTRRAASWPGAPHWTKR